ADGDTGAASALADAGVVDLAAAPAVRGDVHLRGNREDQRRLAAPRADGNVARAARRLLPAGRVLLPAGLGCGARILRRDRAARRRRAAAPVESDARLGDGDLLRLPPDEPLPL